MSDWKVKVRADKLTIGQRFVFSEELGGEGDIVHPTSIYNALGTVIIETEELDFEIEVQASTMLQVAGFKSTETGGIEQEPGTILFAPDGNRAMPLTIQQLATISAHLSERPWSTAQVLEREHTTEYVELYLDPAEGNDKCLRFWIDQDGTTSISEQATVPDEDGDWEWEFIES